jgi:hypothetical protein
MLWGLSSYRDGILSTVWILSNFALWTQQLQDLVWVHWFCYGKLGGVFLDGICH